MSWRQQKEENKLSINLIIFILEACGAFAMKIRDDIVQKRLLSTTVLFKVDKPHLNTDSVNNSKRSRG